MYFKVSTGKVAIASAAAATNALAHGVSQAYQTIDGTGLTATDPAVQGDVDLADTILTAAKTAAGTMIGAHPAAFVNVIIEFRGGTLTITVAED